jgi:hypothetical protein
MVGKVNVGEGVMVGVRDWVGDEVIVEVRVMVAVWGGEGVVLGGVVGVIVAMVVWVAVGKGMWVGMTEGVSEAMGVGEAPMDVHADNSMPKRKIIFLANNERCMGLLCSHHKRMEIKRQSQKRNTATRKSPVKSESF